MMSEKKRKKKEKTCRKLEWAIAHFHFVLGHDIADCIVTLLGWARTREATIQLAALSRGASGNTHAHGLAVGVCRDTNGCIVIGGAGLVSRHSAPRVAIQRSSALQHGAVRERHDAQGARHELYRDTNFVSRPGGGGGGG